MTLEIMLQRDGKKLSPLILRNNFNGPVPRIGETIFSRYDRYLVVGVEYHHYLDFATADRVVVLVTDGRRS